MKDEGTETQEAGGSNMVVIIAVSMSVVLLLIVIILAIFIYRRQVVQLHIVVLAILPTYVSQFSFEAFHSFFSRFDKNRLLFNVPHLFKLLLIDVVMAQLKVTDCCIVHQRNLRIQLKYIVRIVQPLVWRSIHQSQ